MKNISNIKKEQCTGCMACKNICPRKCIKTKKDELGFYYPIIDETKCINCGICLKCCPLLKKENEKNTFTDYVLSYINNDEKQWLKSSSGGAFISICESFININKKAYFYGASYNSNDNTIKHIKTDYNNIKKIQKSKYVQSECDVYEMICKDLKDGNNVVFCGTPCQNKALVNYLDIKHISKDNILLIDFICNGVGSPKTFESSLNSFIKRKKIQKEEIINVNHRGKKKNIFGFNTYFTELETNKKTYYFKKKKDIHTSLYSEKINCRDSCETCPFANSDRCSDITLADFKKYYIYNSDIKSNKNASLIICHSEKGKKYIDNIKNKELLFNTSFDIVKKINPQYFKGLSSKIPKKRNQLKKLYIDFKEEEQKNLKHLVSKKSLKNNIAELFPDQLREKILVKLLKRRKL